MAEKWDVLKDTIDNVEETRPVAPVETVQGFVSDTAGKLLVKLPDIKLPIPPPPWLLPDMTPGVEGELTISNLVISPTEVSPGQPVAIEVTATNNTANSVTANVTLSGDFSEVKSVQVGAGKSAVVGFTVSEETEGTYHVSVDGETGSFTVTSVGVSDIVAVPNTFTIEPDWVNLAELVTISAQYINNGDVYGVRNLTCKVGSETVGQVSLQLNASETQTVTFEFTAQEEGTFQVLLNGLNGTLRVGTVGPVTGSLSGKVTDYDTGNPLSAIDVTLREKVGAEVCR